MRAVETAAGILFGAPYLCVYLVCICMGAKASCHGFEGFRVQEASP